MRGLRVLFAVIVTTLALAVAAGCSVGGNANAVRTGNARVDPSEEGGRPSGPTGSRSSATSSPGGSDGTLSSTELGLVYQFIIQRYIEQTDHAALVEAAIAAVHETGLKSNALPLDLAPT